MAAAARAVPAAGRGRIAGMSRTPPPSERSLEPASGVAAGATVDVDTPEAVARWADVLGTTDEALVHAVQQVGRRLDQVEAYLGSGGQASEQEDG